MGALGAIEEVFGAAGGVGCGGGAFGGRGVGGGIGNFGEFAVLGGQDEVVDV